MTTDVSTLISKMEMHWNDGRSSKAFDLLFEHVEDIFYKRWPEGLKPLIDASTGRNLPPMLAVSILRATSRAKKSPEVAPAWAALCSETYQRLCADGEGMPASRIMRGLLPP